MSWLRRIKRFIAFYNEYKLEAGDVERIIDQYNKVLDARTLHAARVTDPAQYIIDELDDYYDVERCL